MSSWLVVTHHQISHFLKPSACSIPQAQVNQAHVSSTSLPSTHIPSTGLTKHTCSKHRFNQAHMLIAAASQSHWSDSAPGGDRWWHKRQAIVRETSWLVLGFTELGWGSNVYGWMEWSTSLPLGVNPINWVWRWNLLAFLLQPQGDCLVRLELKLIELSNWHWSTSKEI